MNAKLGQHFLTNPSVLKKIVEALDPPHNSVMWGVDMKKGDIVIEVGAGHGELSSELVSWLIDKNSKQKLILIEKDSILEEDLKEKYREEKKVETIHGDALKVLPNLISQSANKLISYKLVGNIPYYITGKLLRIIGEFQNKPERSVFTLQKEVAERICAGTKGMNPPHKKVMWGMNRLAASVQFWAKPEIIGYVSRNDFEPKPDVDSAIILLRPAPLRKIDSELYYKTVRILFQQPRKTILNNLAGGMKTETDSTVRLRSLQASSPQKEMLIKKLLEIGIDPTSRPQNLSIKDIIAIGNTMEDLIEK